MKKLALKIICLIILVATGLLAFACAPSDALGFLTRTGLSEFTEEIKSDSNNVVHFINVMSEDAILLESNGKFGLIDGGEHGENHSHAKYVIDYVLRHTNRLEFVIATHYHIDHMAGLTELINDGRITVDRAYVQNVHYENEASAPDIRNYRSYAKHYVNFIKACEDNGVEIIRENLREQVIKLNDMTIWLLNTEYDPKIYANPTSMVQLLEVNGFRTLFMADVDFGGPQNRELIIAEDIKTLGIGGAKIDLLKVGHHGYGGCSHKNFLSSIEPPVAIYTNIARWINGGVAKRLNDAGITQYANVDFGGIAAVFDQNKANNGTIKYYAINEFPAANKDFYGLP
jgi:beta-lactamase superfamily II metal-dependent hydrolase